MKKYTLPLKAGFFVLFLSSFFSANAFAFTYLPNPASTFDGLPVARQYDDFISYSTQLLTQFGYAGFNGASGVGGLDVVLLTQSGNDNTPVAGGFNFEDPVASATGSTHSFSGTWGAGLQANGPVMVDNLLDYLHNQFGVTANIPVFTFDLAEPGSAASRDLEMLAKFMVYDPINDVEVAAWALDGVNNSSFDSTDFITIEGELSLTGASSTVYTASNTGSGKYDYLVYSPTMNLSLYSGLGYQFRVFAEFRNVDGSGEEAFISGAFAVQPPPPPATAVPEPASLVMLGLGLSGYGFFRKRA